LDDLVLYNTMSKKMLSILYLKEFS